jgi:hypothetical protein
MSLSQEIIQKILLSLDPQIPAFDNFYTDFLTSPLSRFYQDLHSTTAVSYNLMGQQEYRWIQEYVSQLQGSLIEFGCGLSPIADKAGANPAIVHFTGIDFSLKAIEFMRHQYPESYWVHGHLNFINPQSFDHGLCLDASYSSNGIMNLVAKSKKSFLVTRIHEPGKTLRPINGYTKKEWDFTADYRKLIIKWITFLESYSLEKQDSCYSYSWEVIENEMKRHYQQMNKNLTKRTITSYEKNN